MSYCDKNKINNTSLKSHQVWSNKRLTPKLIAGFDARILFFLISLLTSLILFIEDEGKHSLSGLNSPNNVIAFIIYSFGIFAGQYLIYEAAKALSGQSLGLISALSVVPLSFVFAHTEISI